MRGATFEEAVAGFPRDVQTDLCEALSRGSVIPSELVADWIGMLSVDIETLMIRLLPVAAAYARVPVSAYPVGAVALGMPPEPSRSGPGNLYPGANMEFPGQTLSCCVHGEQSAANNAWLHGETGLRSLAVDAAPCGQCRQFLYETATATSGFTVLLPSSENPAGDAYVSGPLTDYLPNAFGPRELGVAGALMEPMSHGLRIGRSDDAAQAALEAANACYGPYSQNYSGVALSGPDGRIYAGRYAENAAFNPSLSPMESALALMNMSRPAQADLTIREAVLVEASSPVSQKSAAEAVLSSVAPAIELTCIQPMETGD